MRNSRRAFPRFSAAQTVLVVNQVRSTVPLFRAGVGCGAATGMTATVQDGRWFASVAERRLAPLTHAERRQSLCSLLLTTRAYTSHPGIRPNHHLGHGCSARSQTHTADASAAGQTSAAARISGYESRIAACGLPHLGAGRTVVLCALLGGRIGCTAGSRRSRARIAPHNSILACVARRPAFPTTISALHPALGARHQSPTFMPTGAGRCPFDQRKSEHLAQTAVGYLRTQRHAGRRTDSGKSSRHSGTGGLDRCCTEHTRALERRGDQGISGISSFDELVCGRAVRLRSLVYFADQGVG